MKVAVAVLVSALALGLTLPAGSEAASTATAECAWKRHSKRVVKHVRRHGRLRKVVRRKHWWACNPIAAPAPGPAASPDPAPSLPTPELPAIDPEPELEANRLAVKSLEYYFVLSRPTVKAGEVTVELNNQGEDPHNLNLELGGATGEPLQIAETASLHRTVATFDLVPGTYRLWCSLPEHEEKGMQTTLTVE